MLRYLLSGLVQRNVISFPLGTFVVNVAGCLAIGFAFERLTSTTIHPHMRVAILIGFLGGFTTFSSFSYETLRLLEARQFLFASINAVGSVAACLSAVWLGQQLSRWMVST